MRAKNTNITNQTNIKHIYVAFTRNEQQTEEANEESEENAEKNVVIYVILKRCEHINECVCVYFMPSIKFIHGDTSIHTDEHISFD